MTTSYVLVTGAARGIGRSVAETLTADGHRVIAVDSDEPTLVRLPSTVAETMIVDDLTDSEELAAKIDKLAPEVTVCALINNAAHAHHGAFHETTSEQWRSTLDGVLGPVEVATRAVLPLFLQQRRGAIVNIASVNGLVAAPGRAAYTAAKGAVHALTRQLAVEYGPHGIRVNSVSPGLIDTPTTPPPDNPEDQRLRVEPYPLGRLGRGEDVADAVSFLVSERADFITGVDIPVDGGLTITSPAAVITTALRDDWHRPPLAFRP